MRLGILQTTVGLITILHDYEVALHSFMEESHRSAKCIYLAISRILAEFQENMMH